MCWAEKGTEKRDPGPPVREGMGKRYLPHWFGEEYTKIGSEVGVVQRGRQEFTGEFGGTGIYSGDAAGGLAWL